MRSRRNVPRSRKNNPTARFQLEQLDRRVLLSVNAGLHSSSLFDDLSFDDFPAESDYTPESYLDEFRPSVEQGYAFPAIMAVGNGDAGDSGGMPGHPVNCTCPICMGLRDAALQGNRADLPDNPDSSDYVGYANAFGAKSSQQYVLFLDFDGATVYSRGGDFWLGSSSVEVPAYDLSSFGWGGREQESIDLITSFVQEDYAAYNITITNEQPTSGEYTTIYVGGDNSWFRPGSSVIGVATYDVGNTDASNYGFAFTDNLSIYAQSSYGSLTKFSEYVANLISHEAGHTYGANHVNDTTALMNPYLPLAERTSMFGANTITGEGGYQDTQTLMGDNLGYAHGSDDYADNALTAGTINDSDIVSGLLERRDDVDAFNFIATQTGSMTIDLDTPACGNLDSYLTVTGPFGMVGTSDDVGSDTDSLLTFDVVAGQEYTVLVSSSQSQSSGTYTLNLEAPLPQAELTIADQSGSPSDLRIDFDTIMVGASAQATFTIANDGGSDLLISQLTATGAFSLDTVSLSGTSSDDFIIAGGASRTITVTFTPTTTGDTTGAITLVSNDADESTVSITLAGQADAAQAEITLTADGTELTGQVVDYGAFERAATLSKIFTITNDGQDDLVVSDISLMGGFTFAAGFDPQSTTIAPGETFNVPVMVTATTRGSVTGTLTIVSNDADEATTQVDLQAQCVGGVISITEQSGSAANDDNIECGSIYVGDAATQTFIISNTGDADLDLDPIVVTGGFTLTDSNGGTLTGVVIAPNESLTVRVVFRADAAGVFSGSAAIASDDSETGTVTLNLTGTALEGELVVQPADEAVAGTINAGAFAVEQDKQIGVWTLTNESGLAHTVTIGVDHANFSVVGANTVTIGAHESYDVIVNFSTELAVAAQATVTLMGTDIDESMVVLVDPYALVNAQTPYRFVDQSGDDVMVRVSGDKQALVRLGADGAADIASIEVIGGQGNGLLQINTKGAGTTLGELTGQTDLIAIKAVGTDLVGNGIDLEGNLKQLMIDTVDAPVNVAAAEGLTIKAQNLGANADLDIDGVLKNLIVDECQGSIKADDIAKIVVRNGDFNGAVDVTGTLDNLINPKGDIGGTINAGRNIGRLLAGRGTIMAQVNAGEAIRQIQAWNLQQSQVNAAVGIDKINLKGDMSETIVAIGPTTIEQTGDSAWSMPTADNYLNNLNVKGTYAASTVAVGVAPSQVGDYISGQAVGNSGMINKVTIGQVQTANDDDPFGLVARNQIGKLKVARKTLAAGYVENDFHAAVIVH